MQPSEMKRHLMSMKGMGSETLIDGVVHFIYNQKNINRQPLSTYLDAFDSLNWMSLPETNECEGAARVWKSYDGVQQLVRPFLTLDILTKLQALYPNEQRFDLGPCVFAAQKRVG